uniref:Putative secreted peptide n=1 Tax=Anopheles braziliensis TaxID=58242 RepID=A0A2M3ZQV2_9DIPT
MNNSFIIVIIIITLGGRGCCTQATHTQGCGGTKALSFLLLHPPEGSRLSISVVLLLVEWREAGRVVVHGECDTRLDG